MSKENPGVWRRTGKYLNDITGITIARDKEIDPLDRISSVPGHILAPLLIEYLYTIEKQPDLGNPNRKTTLDLYYIAGITNFASLVLGILVHPLAGIALKTAEIAISRRVGRRIAARQNYLVG